MSDEALRKHMAMQMANQHNHKQPSPNARASDNPSALNVMDDLFTRLKAVTVVGNAFKTPQEEAIVKQEWMLGFREEGITKQSMIDDGLDVIRAKARRSSAVVYFPGLGEFIDSCLGSNDKTEFAKRALDLFNSAQKQIDSVGKLVVSKHSFELKQMKASDTNKKFIELYLRYAENNAIEPIESNLLTETVQLSEEQRKDADKRALDAQNQFLSRFSGLIEYKPETKQVNSESGLKTGSTKVYSKSVSDKQKEKERQLKIARGKL